ncbi:MAG: class I SAM-dependent methyltransferase, partial [Acidobacteriota bacterium]
MHPVELTLRRALSRYPRAKRWASAVRRRVLWRGRSAAGHWDEHVGEVESTSPRGWLDSELVEREHIRPQITGDPEVSYLESFARSHLGGSGGGSVVSLGCGGGNLERALVSLGVAHRILGLDASPASIDLAERLAREAGLAERVQYRVVDVDRLSLE